MFDMIFQNMKEFMLGCIIFGIFLVLFCGFGVWAIADVFIQTVQETPAQ